MKDEEIITLYFQRDEDAIRETQTKYGARLRRFSFGIVQDAGTAEECENDVYLEAWNAIPPHDPKDYLFAFLARIARHISLDACRKRGRLKRSAYIVELGEELAECLPAAEDVESRMDEELLVDAINRFLASTDETKRKIFVRRYWYLDSVKDISARYGFSESKVKTTLHRVRESLRDFLEAEGF